LIRALLRDRRPIFLYDASYLAAEMAFLPNRKTRTWEEKIDGTLLSGRRIQKYPLADVIRRYT
jgi:hypothetical protein